MVFDTWCFFSFPAVDGDPPANDDIHTIRVPSAVVQGYTVGGSLLGFVFQRLAATRANGYTLFLFAVLSFGALSVSFAMCTAIEQYCFAAPIRPFSREAQSYSRDRPYFGSNNRSATLP